MNATSAQLSENLAVNGGFGSAKVLRDSPQFVELGDLIC